MCEKRIRNMEVVCEKLPDNDSAHRALDTSRRALAEVRDQIETIYLKLLQHPDKWREWNEM